MARDLLDILSNGKIRSRWSACNEEEIGGASWWCVCLASFLFAFSFFFFTRSFLANFFEALTMLRCNRIKYVCMRRRKVHQLAWILKKPTFFPCPMRIGNASCICRGGLFPSRPALDFFARHAKRTECRSSCAGGREGGLNWRRRQRQFLSRKIVHA